jgi:hypothetical protein
MKELLHGLHGFKLDFPSRLLGVCRESKRRLTSGDAQNVKGSSWCACLGRERSSSESLQ